MGGGGGGGDGHSTTYKGLTMHQPKQWHTVTGKGMCALMWVVKIRLKGWDVESLVAVVLMMMKRLKNLFFFMVKNSRNKETEQNEFIETDGRILIHISWDVVYALER
ncbi:hypothetical protein MKX01_018676 [Papaver californicum]|nr:hypothetical protein MKX01_018676 [Papaver californicum]